MDLVARKKLNLEVLKRHDANICDILDQSAHAVVYKFDTEKASWEKLGYEGVIFLTQGKSAPYFGLYVLNRLSIENFSLHLTDFEEINLTDEFIIYLTSEGEACALWLFEKKDRERILAKILKLHEGIKALPSTQQQQQQLQQQQQQQPPKPTESKLDILQMLKMATNNTPSATASPPLQSVGNDLLRVLGQKSSPHPQQPQKSQPQVQQQQPHKQRALLRVPIPQQLPPQQPQFMQHPPMPPMMNQTPPNFAIPTSDSADRAGNGLQELFDSTNQSMANLNMAEPPQRRVMANGELTKPFYPPFVNMSPVASPNNRNPGALLQALHGGLPPPPPSHSLPPPPQHQQQQQQQSVPMGMPLMPQQVMGLMRPEVGRRFGGGRPMLSKPEFIQQLLNMIQCDPTFFDILYENYKGQMGPPPPPPV